LKKEEIGTQHLLDFIQRKAEEGEVEFTLREPWKTEKLREDV